MALIPLLIHNLYKTFNSVSSDCIQDSNKVIKIDIYTRNAEHVFKDIMDLSMVINS